MDGRKSRTDIAFGRALAQKRSEAALHEAFC